MTGFLRLGIVATVLFAICLSGCNRTQGKAVEEVSVVVEDNSVKEGGKRVVKEDNAPKEIKSEDISAFYVAFYTENRWREDSIHNFRFQIGADEKGELRVHELISDVSVLGDKELLDRVQSVIREEALNEFNGVYEVNESLPYEYQGCEMNVSYASGETLRFTIINDPYAQWAERLYDVFNEWFLQKGSEILSPEAEESQLVAFGLEITENNRLSFYGGIEVNEANSIDGYTYLIEGSIYDMTTQERVMEKYGIPPQDYYEEITQILNKHNAVFKNGAPHEPTDTGGESISIYGQYESGVSLNIYVESPDEIEEITPMVNELREYYESLF